MRKRYIVLIFTCILTLCIAPISFSEASSCLNLSQSTLSLGVGEIGLIESIITYSDDTIEDVTEIATWTTSNPVVATVDGGIITAHCSGDVIISVSYNGLAAFATVTVNENVVSSLSISDSSISVTTGETYFLEAYALYANGAEMDITDNAIWSSSNPEIVSVDTGIVVGLEEGSSTITVSYRNKTASIMVSVLKPTISKLSLSENSISLSKFGSVILVQADVIYEDGSDEDVTEGATWSSSNLDVVSVDGGVITAKGEGTAVVHASYEGYRASLTVSVTYTNSPDDSQYVLWQGSGTFSEVNAYKDWKLKFNQAVDQTTINSDNIFIFRGIGSLLNNKVNVIVIPGSDGKSVTVYPPEGGYQNGEIYTMYIKNIKSVTGVYLNKSLKMPFYITASGNSGDGSLKVESVSADNGTITVNLSGIPLTALAISDFTVTQSINGAASITIAPTAISINGTVVTLNVPIVVATNVSQNVIDTVSYKGGTPVIAAAFQVSQSSETVGNWVDITSNGTFNGPCDVTVDSYANVYVTDSGNKQIKKLAHNSSIWANITGNGGFERPKGIAADILGNVYVADEGTMKIKKLMNSTWTDITGGGNLNWPYGVAVDSSDNVYVVESMYFKVKKLVGGSSTWIDITGNGSCFNATDVAVDSSGNVYVVDSGYSRIIKLSNEKWTDITGNGNFSSPQGITVDSAGNVYVADTGNNKIKKLTNGTWTDITGNGCFDHPNGIAVDGLANIYVVDAGNNKIKKLPSGWDIF